jgi:hypothetical protein
VNNNSSWVKLYRKLNNSAFKKKPLTVALFVHFLINVNTETKKIIWNDEEITVLPGQIITGRKSLSEDTGITQQSIRTSLKILKSTSTITIKTFTKFSVITINKWDEYQSSTSKLTNKQPTTNQQLTTTKEYKNIRNKEYNTLESVVESDFKEIAETYKVSLSFVQKIYEELVLYCGSTGKKYANYKMTLMAWVRRKLEDKPTRLKDLEPNQILDIRENPERLLFYKRRNYDVSRVRTR